MNDVLKPVIITVSKQNFTISKFDGKDYKSNIGNFAKHLKRFGHTIDSYILQFYSDTLPICVESGKISDNRVKGSWNKYIPLCAEYKKLQIRYKYLCNRLSEIIRDDYQHYTEYLSFDYWMLNSTLSFSEIIDRLEFFVKRGVGNSEGSVYKRLSDNFYDSDWAAQNKSVYINSVTQGTLPQLYNKWSKRGMKQRGYSQETWDTYYSNRPTMFRDVNFQKEQNAKAHKKHPNWGVNSVRCIEFWIKRGYNFDESKNIISELQKINSIESIKRRLQCTDVEAKLVQKQIYQRRKETFDQKSEDELMDIRRRQDSKSFEYCLRKCNFNIEDAKKLYTDLLTRRTVPFGRASKESLKVFLPLYKFLRNSGINREDMYLGVGGSNEYFLYDKESKKIRLYDFTILSKRIIIEYDGQYWHSKPTSADNDTYKDSLAKSYGFTVYRIKSNDNNKLTNLNNFLYEQLRIRNPNWDIV